MPSSKTRTDVAIDAAQDAVRASIEAASKVARSSLDASTEAARKVEESLRTALEALSPSSKRTGTTRKSA